MTLTKTGWWEEYRCGCVSDFVKRKKDLLGYCAIHGEDTRHIWPPMRFVKMESTP